MNEGEALTRFTRRLIALRRRHELLRSRRYLYGEPVAPGLPDIDWWDERGLRLAPEDWAKSAGPGAGHAARPQARGGRRRDRRPDAEQLGRGARLAAAALGLAPPADRQPHPELAGQEIRDSYYLLPHAAAIFAWEKAGE